MKLARLKSSMVLPLVVGIASVSSLAPAADEAALQTAAVAIGAVIAAAVGAIGVAMLAVVSVRAVYRWAKGMFS